MKQVKWIIKTLASLKMAVVVLLSIGALVAWGTIVEAMYNDARVAQETVYHTWFSYGIYGLLCINLTAVILDRYPWKKDHISFIAAHVGIITLLMGSLVTRYYGLDGTLSIDIGSRQNKVSVSETDLMVYASMDGSKYRSLYQKEVHFFKNPPTKQKPLVISLPSGDIEIFKFYPYAVANTKYVSKKGGNPTLRFQLVNDRVIQSDWVATNGLRQGEVRLGPAKVIMTRDAKSYAYDGGNVLRFYPLKNNELFYEVYTDRLKKKTKSGTVKPGDKFQLGWMGLEARILKYLPEAEEKTEFIPMEQASELTISALQFTYDGKEYWIGKNSLLRFYSDSELYVFTYGNRSIPLDFYVSLKDFKVGRYPGGMKASSYESLVTVPDVEKDILISMNEPLHHKGLTFYQASFQEDETGKPVTSVLSVNYDPGRWWKYLGSLLIVFGSAHLFYRKSRRRKKHA